MISIRRGLDLPISGAPEQVIHTGPKIRTVAVLGPDYPGLKPGMLVRVGDRVARGQALFIDKRAEGVQFTAPAAGTVAAINRGDKRLLLSVVIDVDGSEEREFARYEPAQLATLGREQVRDNLVDSGLWTALRTRPFSKVPAPSTTPHSIFVTAMDTSPLAADPALVLAAEADSFRQGVQVLAALTDGKVFVVGGAGGATPRVEAPRVVHEEFAGPHPAGLVGTHIHFLDPVHERKTVWSIGYQDVIAIGKLFTTGRLHCERVIALGGPSVERPRLLKTLLGASVEELCAGEIAGGEPRILSGGVLAGRSARGSLAFLGRYHTQVSVLPEGRERLLLGWLSPGAKRHSMMRIYLSSLFGLKPVAMNTSTNGSPRALVPIGAYEKVMPLDVLATPLLKSLIVGDVEAAAKLGALELDEEDLALCTYVCPGKYEYGPILRDNLTRIEMEA
ncbi:MAG: Na(+)-translocating NADH-quinone reductase subunit A [Gammaproteobacteria bacterium]|nr:Na(+)-translocating NADH-quinone reductase subunit A [Gammaproteobacteria bacterium]